MCLQFGFVIFWRKDFGTKAAHKMLVKLTLGRRLVGPGVEAVPESTASSFGESTRAQCY
jgi:hypothetical protein